ncbi:hypothetical protein GS415_00735 [Rhodococcus hoagii]|nr:hypothetical protein [Prescottella equi]
MLAGRIEGLGAVLDRQPSMAGGGSVRRRASLRHAQSTTGATVIAYADRVVTEGAPIVLSATADGSRISVQTLGDGAPRSAWINCGPAQTDAVNITSSGSAGAPTVQIYSGVHSDAKRDKIMRLMADRYGVAI